MRALNGRRRLATMIATVLATVLSTATDGFAQAPIPEMLQLPPPPRVGEGGLIVYPLRGDLYMIAGPGANSLVSVGVDGVMVIDPQPEPASAALLSEIRKLSDRPMRMVLDTTGDPDHVAGNKPVAAAGVDLNGGVSARPAIVDGAGQATIWARQEVLDRLVAVGGDAGGLPTDVYFVDHKDMFFNGNGVEMIHVPAGHTAGDSLVWFRQGDVMAVGDIYTPDRYPVIDLANGGSIDGLVDGLNMILRRAIPQFNAEGGTLIVPGHGRLSDEGDVSEYRDMVTIVRDRVKAMIAKKMTLAQVKAARPTLDYDVLYGADKGEVFVEQAYRSLTAPRASKTSVREAR